MKCGACFVSETVLWLLSKFVYQMVSN